LIGSFKESVENQARTTKRMASIFIAVTLMAVLVFSIAEAQGAPYYRTVTNHKLVAIVKFDSDCWDEIYARAVPYHNNQVVLNKQTIKNNDAPDNGPSERIRLAWFFQVSKMDQTAITNDGKIRFYVEIELVNHQMGQTVTQIKTFNAANFELQFDQFNMKTNKALCQN
jgi:hypothetical protein